MKLSLRKVVFIRNKLCVKWLSTARHVKGNCSIFLHFFWRLKLLCTDYGWQFCLLFLTWFTLHCLYTFSGCHSQTYVLKGFTKIIGTWFLKNPTRDLVPFKVKPENSPYLWGCPERYSVAYCLVHAVILYLFVLWALLQAKVQTYFQSAKLFML